MFTRELLPQPDQFNRCRGRRRALGREVTPTRTRLSQSALMGESGRDGAVSDGVGPPVTVIYERRAAELQLVRPQKQFINNSEPGPFVFGSVFACILPFPLPSCMKVTGRVFRLQLRLAPFALISPRRDPLGSFPRRCVDLPL